MDPEWLQWIAKLKAHINGTEQPEQMSPMVPGGYGGMNPVMFADQLKAQPDYRKKQTEAELAKNIQYNDTLLKSLWSK